jgi:hypothetical protein
MYRHRLLEGLRAKDLKGFVESTFTVDQYTSKMGEDRDVLVIGFKVNDKAPALDLMEFIEKGYRFVLDADMSSGEERDGHYQVFVEMERDRHAPINLKDLLNGISQLTDNYDWRFRYHKEMKSHEFSEQTIVENVPLDQTAYKAKMMESKTVALERFFNQSAFDSIQLDEDNMVTINKMYSGSVSLHLLAFGNYTEVKDSIQGGIQLDEASQSQVTFLEKYLGNYEIHKIADKFLIRNGNKAMIFSKERW